MNDNEIKRRARLDEYGNLYVTPDTVFILMLIIIMKMKIK